MISKNDKVISASEAMTLLGRETLGRRRGAGLAGYLTLRDSTGRVVWRKKNLIVLRGRTYALELLFGSPIGSSGVTSGPVPYVSDIGRTVIAFGVGNGGAPGSSPFTPYAPVSTGAQGVELASPIPFRFHDTSQAASGDPSLYIESGEIASYANAAAVPGGTVTQFYYYLKLFQSNPPAWVFSESNNQVYKSVMLSVSNEDCQTAAGNSLNELCLYIGRDGAPDAAGGTTIINPEMFSRITFATEYMSAGKGLSIEYDIYA
jgi:hypothetical protein